jgi:dihydropteroate synthase
MADVVSTVTGLAERAVAAGVRPDAVLVDAAHDFGKNTYHSLEVTRRMSELVATGWPVLVAVSNKKFLGEVLDADKDGRLEATLAATTLCAAAGARVFRAHQVGATRRALDTVAAIQGLAPPKVSRRALS